MIGNLRISFNKYFFKNTKVSLIWWDILPGETSYQVGYIIRWDILPGETYYQVNITSWDTLPGGIHYQVGYITRWDILPGETYYLQRCTVPEGPVRSNSLESCFCILLFKNCSIHVLSCKIFALFPET